ncbi:hypothetical protein BO226_24820 (plasmid) [Rhodococcus sp. 2G]|nr:hypothetical protein BO226_24820 [Rhodococcus sp. 2G]
MTMRRRSEFDASLHSTTVISPAGSTMHTSAGPATVDSSRSARALSGTPGTCSGAPAMMACR